MLGPSPLALRDDYHHWKLTGFSGRGGKLLYIDPTDKGCLQIFFDDNISEKDSIVDVRDVRDGQ
jgi:hypothetical protein